MKKSILGLALLLASTFGALSFATPVNGAPQAATFNGGVYYCPIGWTLVQTEQYVTYNVVVGYQLQYQCGPLGVLCRWVNVPVTQPVTQLVPANYCVPGVVVVPGQPVLR
jgi:hypothetical protein